MTAQERNDREQMDIARGDHDLSASIAPPFEDTEPSLRRTRGGAARTAVRADEAGITAVPEWSLPADVAPDAAPATTGTPGPATPDTPTPDTATPAPAAAAPVAAAPARTPGFGWIGRSTVTRQQLEADRAAIRLASWPRSVGILVANPKGGAGKTPSSLIIGGVLAASRGGQTCVYEVCDDAGALAVRAEGPAYAGMAELVRDLGDIRGAGQLAGYATQQTSYAAVIGSGDDRAPLDRDTVRSLSDLLGFFYPIRVMDSGNQVSSSAFQGALDSADVLVVPVLEAIDSVSGAHQLVRALRRRGGAAAELARNAIGLRIDDGRRVTPAVRSHVTDALESAGITRVIDIPYDPHIAARSTISLERLRPATLAAYTRVAATVTGELLRVTH